MGTGRDDRRAGGSGHGYAAKAEALDESQRRIEQAERERDDLWQWLDQLERLAETGLHARGLAHDMGNALTSMMASCELALLQNDPSEFRGALEQGLAVTRQAARRLQVFMEFTRRNDEEVHPLAASEVGREAERFLAYPLRKCQIEVEHSCEGHDLVACAHPHLLQVVCNAMLTLVRGAADTGSKIEVQVRGDEETVRIDVRRTGATRTEGSSALTRAPKCRGTTGLETALSRRILQRNGGSMEVFGDAGDPVCFRIHMPAARASARGGAASSGLEPSTTDAEAGGPAASWHEPASAWSPRGHTASERSRTPSKNGRDR